MASDTEAEEENDAEDDQAAMMLMVKGRHKAGKSHKAPSDEKKPQSPTAHLRTQAAKLAYRMLEDSRQAFEAEQAEFDRIEGLLKAVHQEL